MAVAVALGAADGATAGGEGSGHGLLRLCFLLAMAFWLWQAKGREGKGREGGGWKWVRER